MKGLKAVPVPMHSLINLADLETQTFGDADIRREVIAIFREQAPIILAALEGGAGEARGETAHRLKGSALALGAHPLAEAAGRLEAMPDDAAQLAEVRSLLDGTLQALLALAQG